MMSLGALRKSYVMAEGTCSYVSAVGTIGSRRWMMTSPLLPFSGRHSPGTGPPGVSTNCAGRAREVKDYTAEGPARMTLHLPRDHSGSEAAANQAVCLTAQCTHVICSAHVEARLEDTVQKSRSHLVGLGVHSRHCSRDQGCANLTPCRRGWIVWAGGRAEV